MYLRLSDSKFPCYEPEYDRAKDKSDFVSVIETVPEYNPTSHRLGAYPVPHMDENKVWRVERPVVSRSTGEIEERASIALEDLRIERDRRLAESDIMLLRRLEEKASGAEFDELKEYRQRLRDAPASNSDPKKIKLPVRP